MKTERLLKSMGIIVTAAGWSLSGGSARGDILVDHPPGPYSGGPGADTSFYGPFGEPGWEVSADYFQLPSNNYVNQINWYGFYGSAYGGGSWYPPSGDEFMRIRFYDARSSDGLPGLVLYEETFLNALRTETDIHVDQGQTAYEFQAALRSPFVAEANQRYWLEIAQIDDIDSTYRWVASVAGHLAFHNNYYLDWTDGAFDAGLAFRLDGLPEPRAIALVSLVFFCVRFGRRRSYTM